MSAAVTMDMKNASRGDLLFAFCRNMEGLEKVESLEVAQDVVDESKAIMYELRRRALANVSISQLADAHTVANELNGSIMNLGQRMKERREKSGLYVPGDPA